MPGPLDLFARASVRHLGRAFATTLLGVALLASGASVAQAAAPIVVQPGNLNGWELTREGTDPATNASFVKGPGTTPAGTGSLRQRVKPGEKDILQTRAFNGVAVAGLQVAYSTYTSSASAFTASVNMSIDTTGDGLSDETLVYEPYEQASWRPGSATVASATWQRWQTEGGAWWIYRAGGLNTSGPRYTLAQYSALNPTAKIATVSAAAFKITVGSSGAGWPVADRYIDKVTVNGQDYDFEATSAVVWPGALGGWIVANSGTTATSTFVNGPAGMPAGTGSLRQVSGNGADSATLQTSAVDGALLDDLTQLSYSTYVDSATPGGKSTYASVAVDLNGNGFYDGVGAGKDDRIVFQPIYQGGSFGGTPSQCPGVSGCVAARAWQSWNTEDGAWWSIAENHARYFSLDTYKREHPAVKLVAQGYPAVRFILGGDPGFAGFSSNIDQISINGNRTDLEATVPVVDCDAGTDDITVVQAAIDGAADGATIGLRGTCDFSTASPHGGDVTSITAAAVVIRPGAPVRGLTITSDGAPQSATILGSGTQTAFLITSGNDDITIKGLKFTGFARPIVAIDTRNTTIGTGGLPPLATGGTNLNGNAISGDASMDSAILAVARTASPMTFAYGASGAKSTTVALSGELTGLSVAGNAITYSPPGAPDGDSRDVVGVDIRQRGGEANNITVASNAIDFLSSNFPSFNVNAVRVFAHTDAPARHIRTVRILNNVMGIGDQTIHSAGRAGIVVRAAEDLLIQGNDMRVNISSTSVPMPGGGIVLSDSSGTVSGNSVRLFGDPPTVGTDFGSVGVIDDLLLLFGVANPGPSTSNVIITNNTLRSSTHRGVVLNGAAAVTVSGNDIATESEVGLSIGEAATGPGNPSNPGTKTVQGPVTAAVACGNTYRVESTGALTTDNASEVRIDALSGSTANAVPGGTSPNLGCTPSVALAPSLVGPGGTLTASGKGWASRPVGVTLTDGITSLSHSVSASSAGAFSSLFTAAEVASLNDGQVRAVATASEPALAPGLLTRASSAAIAVKDTAAPTVSVTAVTDPIGSAQANAVSATGAVEAGSSVSVTASDGTTTTTPVNATVVSGSWTAGPIDVRALRDGQVVFTARAVDAALNASTAARSALKDVLSPAASIDLLDGDSKVNAAEAAAGVPAHWEVGEVGPAVTVSLSAPGQSAPAACVLSARPRGPVTQTIPAACFAALAEGPIVAKVAGADQAGNPVSATDVSLIDRVVSLPVITLPTQGSLGRSAQVSFAGTAEPGAAVDVREGASSVGVATATGSGTWSLQRTLGDGSHSVVVVATDTAGNVSASSPARSFSIDTVAPVPPIITSPIQSATETSTVVTVSGTAEPGASVSVFEGAIRRTTMTASGSGDWSDAITFDRGARTISADAIDAAGNSSARSIDRNFDVVSSAPAAPAITYPAASQVVGANEVTLVGGGEPASTIRVYEGAGLLGQVTATTQGAWSLPVVLAAGNHLISVTATDGSNATGPAAARAFRVDLGLNGRPQIASPAEGAQVGAAVGVSGSTNPNAGVSIFEGSTFLGSVTSSSSGAWSLTLPPLPTGSHGVTAAIRDAGGSVTLQSPVRTFEVDATPPTVSVDTPSQTVFAPGAAGAIAGKANDNKVVSSVVLRYFSTLTGALARVVAASCTGCNSPGGVTWTDSANVLQGNYRVDVTALDSAGNSSTVAHVWFTRL